MYVQFNDFDIESIQKAKEIIVSDLATHYSIELIATKVNIGKTKLKIGFRLYYSIGLYSFLKKQRMIKATELLIGTDKGAIRKGMIIKNAIHKFETNFVIANKKIKKIFIFYY